MEILENPEETIQALAQKSETRNNKQRLTKKKQQRCVSEL